MQKLYKLIKMLLILLAWKMIKTYDTEREKGREKEKREREQVFGLVWFDIISTIVDYLMPNPFYTEMISKHVLLITFLNESDFIFLHR